MLIGVANLCFFVLYRKKNNKKGENVRIPYDICEPDPVNLSDKLFARWFALWVYGELDCLYGDSPFLLHRRSCLWVKSEIEGLLYGDIDAAHDFLVNLHRLKNALDHYGLLHSRSVCDQRELATWQNLIDMITAFANTHYDFVELPLSIALSCASLPFHYDEKAVYRTIKPDAKDVPNFLIQSAIAPGGIFPRHSSTMAMVQLERGERLTVAVLMQFGLLMDAMSLARLSKSSLTAVDEALLNTRQICAKELSYEPLRRMFDRLVLNIDKVSQLARSCIVPSPLSVCETPDRFFSIVSPPASEAGLSSTRSVVAMEMLASASSVRQ